MRAHLALLFLIMAQLFARAATIVGPVYLSYSNRPYSGPILLRPLSTPLPYTPNLITGGDFTVRTDTNGLFSVELQPGNYRVQVGADRPFVIDVPTNAATYTMLERITNALAWNSSIRPSTNSYATANSTTEGVVRTYSTQASPVTWTTNDVAAISAYIGQLVYPTVDAMLAAPVPILDGVRVYCLGRNSINDGGGGDFTWSVSSTVATNAGAIHGLYGVSVGRYFRSTQWGYTSTRQWGIFPGTVTEAQVAVLNSAIAWNAANGLFTKLDTGTHNVQTNIQLVSNAKLVGDPESVWLRDYVLQSQYHKALFSIANAPLPGDTTVTSVPIVATNVALVNVIGGATSTNKLGPIIAFMGVDYGRIQNCEIRPGAYDWSITYYGHNAIITDNRIKSTYPDTGSTIFTDGIHVLGGTNGVVANNSIESGDDNIAFSLFNNAGISHWHVGTTAHKSWRANALRFQVEAAWVTNKIQNIDITGGGGEGGLLRNGTILFYNPVATNNPYPFKNISISHYKLRGGGLGGQPTPIGLSYGIHATGVEGLTLTDVSLENTPYGNYIWGCKDVVINDCKFTGGLYSSGFLSPLRVQDCVDLKISGGRFVPELTTVAGLQIVSVTNSVISGGAYIEGKSSVQPALLYSLYNGSVKVTGAKVVNTAVGGASIVFANDPINAIVAGNTLSATTPLFWTATGSPPKGSRVHWNEGIPEKETEATTFDVLNTANNGYVGSVNSRANATKLQIQATNGMITLAQDGVSGGTKNIRLGAQPSDASKVDNAIAYSSDNGGATQLTLNGGTGLMNSHQILNFNITTNSYEGTGWTAGQLTYRGFRFEKGVSALASPDSYFQVVSTEHGSRPVPLLTTAQANAISVQNQGLWIWDTDEVSPLVSVGAATSRYRYLLPRISADRGDADVTLISTDAETQIFNTPLTANRTVNLPASNVRKGDRFRIVRTGTGAFTLNVGGVKTIPASTAATVDVQHNGTVWQLAGYMEHTPSGGGGGGGVPTGRLVNTQYSLTGGGDLSADRTLSLVNDTASPGANKVYGTDGSGVRGWKNDPAGGGGAGYGGTSTTSVSFGTGSKTWTTQTNLAYVAGSRIRAIETGSSQWMEGEIISYSGGSLNVNVDLLSGVGTYTTWVFSIAGVRGATGTGFSDADYGDVTIGSGVTSITIDNGAVSNAKLANMSASTIKARITGSTGAPEDATFTQLLDLVGSAAQGDILYRGASTWTRLGAGTSGQFLKTQGTGANPLWASVPGGGDALTSNPLSQFASTTSSQLAGVLSNESGTGLAVFNDGATLTNTTLNGLSFTGTAGSTLSAGAGGTIAYTANNLSVFASTTSSQLSGVLSDETGSGAAVFGTSPTLTTPVLGVATATSINKVAITAPATSATLTIANGKTLTANNTVTLSGTDGSTLTFGGGGTVAYTANNLSAFASTTSSQLAGVISDETGSGAAVFATSPTLTTPTIGVATATSINKVAITAPATSATLTIADGKTATVNNSITFAGTDSTTMTFPPASASIGYLGIPQGSKSADYTLVLADAGTHIFHPSSDANSRTFTIPANGSVAFPVGTAVTFYNASANSCTIAITTDTLRKAGTGTTGSVTLPQYAMATALKVTTTEWIISGNGI